jgi:hypothetical protein
MTRRERTESRASKLEQGSYAMIEEAEGGNTSDTAIGKPGMLSQNNSSRINVPE